MLKARKECAKMPGWEDPDADYMKFFSIISNSGESSPPTTLDFDENRRRFSISNSGERTSRSSTAEGGLRSQDLLNSSATRLEVPKGKRLNEILNDPELSRGSAAPVRAKEILEQMKGLAITP
jgi:hypothetical protein